jgi:hypothetical protein
MASFMPSLHAPAKIVIIDKEDRGEGRLLMPALQGAVGDAGATTTVKRIPEHSGLASQISEDDYWYEVRVGLSRENPDIVFIVIGQSAFSVNRSLPITKLAPGLAIGFIWSLVERYPVHIALPIEAFQVQIPWFTPLHSMALGLSGVAGVWEARPRLMKYPELFRVLENLVDYWHMGRFFLSGKPAEEAFDFVQELKVPDWPAEWPPSFGGSRTTWEMYRRYCFQTALALAALDESEFKLPARSSQAMEQYATRLKKFHARTGFDPQVSTLSRALGYLERRWKDLNPDLPARRRKELMPEFARQDLFPRQPPCVRNTDPLQVSLKLWEAIEEWDFERGWNPHVADALGATMGKTP